VSDQTTRDSINGGFLLPKEKASIRIFTATGKHWARPG
jgi:hypothetical protein